MSRQLLYFGVFTLCLITGISAQSRVNLMSIYMGGSLTVIAVDEDLDPQFGGLIFLGIGYDGIGSTSYVGVGLEVDYIPDWVGLVGEIDIGLGSMTASKSKSSVSTFFLGVRAGYGKGTYSKETYIYDWDETSVVDNDFSGVPILLVLGYRIFGKGFGFSIDLAPGILYVTDQDPEVEEVRIETLLPMVEVRLRLSFPYDVL